MYSNSCWKCANTKRSKITGYYHTDILYGGRTQFSSAYAKFTITFKLFMLWCPFFARGKVNYRSIYSRNLTRVCAVAMASAVAMLLPWQWGWLKTRLNIMVFVYLKQIQSLDCFHLLQTAN